MSSYAVSAPGKLFLLGEYAVLENAPALLAAVDRRVAATIRPSDTGRWEINAPNLGIHALALGPDGALPETLNTTTRARLGVYDAVRATLIASAPTPRPLAITIDSSAFAHQGHKLGLGSSAAVAAALSAGLARAWRIPADRKTLCEWAISAHRQAQHGAGSGADVASSIYGGVIEYRAGHVRSTLNWPEGLAGMAVMTGAGASTTGLVARVAAFAARDETTYRRDIERLTALAEDARQALCEPARFLALAADYFTALKELDAHSSAGIVSERHRELAALAAYSGGVFKTSGAGGGDVGLAFAHSGEPARRLAAALENDGAVILPLQFGADGLRVTETGID